MTCRVQSISRLIFSISTSSSNNLFAFQYWCSSSFLIVSRASRTCFKKCVVKYHEPDLAVGEMSCVDRCVAKYMESQEKIGVVMANFDKQLKAQEEAKATLSGKLGN